MKFQNDISMPHAYMRTCFNQYTPKIFRVGGGNLTGPRPDKIFQSNSNLVKIILENCIKLSVETGAGCKYFLFHSVHNDFKADISAGHGTNFRLKTEKIDSEYFKIYGGKIDKASA